MTKLRLPSISYVVARSEPDQAIGCENTLPWRLKSDLARFKQTTLNHVIIMGRLTHESIGRILPNRISIVLTREPPFDPRNSFWKFESTALVWADDRPSALFFADVITIQKQQSEFFVIGGSYMFELFKDLFNRVYLTEVLNGGTKGADSFFPYNFDKRKWNCIERKRIEAGPDDEFPTNYCVLERKQKTVRYVELGDYLTDRDAKQKWLQEKMEIITKPSRRPDETLQLQYEMFEEQAL